MYHKLSKTIEKQCHKIFQAMEIISNAILKNVCQNHGNSFMLHFKEKYDRFGHQRNKIKTTFTTEKTHI